MTEREIDSKTNRCPTTEKEVDSKTFRNPKTEKEIDSKLISKKKRTWILRASAVITVLVISIVVILACIFLRQLSSEPQNQKQEFGNYTEETTMRTTRITSRKTTTSESQPGKTSEATTIRTSTEVRRTSRPTTSRMSTSSEAPLPEVCETEECVKLGARIKALMNTEVNPCDDFYEYSCGNYDKNGQYNSELVDIMMPTIGSFGNFLKNYKAETNSERIAMVFMEKCLNTKEDLELNEDVWKSDDLTEILIELSKVEPIHTGLIKNFIKSRETSGKLALSLFLINGIDDGSEMKQVADEILKSDEALKIRQGRYLSDSSDYNITFIDLKKYAAELLPEKNRELAKNWMIAAYFNEMKLLEKVVAQMGVKKIKEYLHEKWKKKLQGYLHGQRNPDNAEQACSLKSEQLFPGTLGMIFVKNFVKSKNIEKTNKMFEDLKVAFNEMLDENTWMDEDLKNTFRKEVKAIKSSIGIPDEHKDLRNIDRMYARVEKEQKVEDQSYLTLVRNLLKMNSEETFLRVARGESITYLGSTLDINANFFTRSHRVSVAPIFLIYPYIDENLPEWNTIASLAYIIGHEIGHSFDAKNTFISDLMKHIPMSEATKNELNQRIDCIIKKYNNFQFPDGSYSNGDFTKKEDSADMIGFNLAYRLFKKLGKQQRLAGLEDHTVDQSFFLKMANQYCHVSLNEKAIKKQKEDKHSAMKFRINGMMSNSVDFARAFRCEKNKPMNPEKKCPLFK